MGDIADVVGGGTPSTADPANFEGGSVPWITPADLSGYRDKFIGQGSRNITAKGLNGSGAKLLPAGTVLFSSRAPIGYVAIAANPLSTNQGFKSCVPYLAEMSGYIYYFLKSARREIEAQASGTTFKEISGSGMRNIDFPLAPLAEQSLIA